MAELTLKELLNSITPLAKLYHKKLPRRGWAGRTTKIEKEYIKLAKATRQKTPQTHPPLVDNGVKN